MTTRKPLVRVNGQIVQLPAGDALDGASGDFKKDGSVSMTGPFDQSPPVEMPSAYELGAPSAASDTIIVTGTAGIQFLGYGSPGMRRVLNFTTSVEIVHEVSWINLPGNANITTQPGDVAEFFCVGGQSWRCISYTRKNGTALVSSGGSGPSSTDALPEGTTNLYFTNARTRSATRFTWDQSTAMAVWTVPHNTNGYPSVTVVDTLGNVVTPDISYVDANTVQITHGAAYAGKAYIN